MLLIALRQIGSHHTLRRLGSKTGAGVLSRVHRRVATLLEAAPVVLQRQCFILRVDLGDNVAHLGVLIRCLCFRQTNRDYRQGVRQYSYRVFHLQCEVSIVSEKVGFQLTYASRTFLLYKP